MAALTGRLSAASQLAQQGTNLVIARNLRIPSYNKVTLIGRIGSAPLNKVTANGQTEYTRMSVCTDRPQAKGSTNRMVDWHEVVVFNQFVQERLKKLNVTRGDTVLVEGVLHTSDNKTADKAPSKRVNIVVSSSGDVKVLGFGQHHAVPDAQPEQTEQMEAVAPETIPEPEAHDQKQE